MVVYIVTCGHEDDNKTYILGAYSSKVKANQAIAQDDNEYCDMAWYEIVPKEVDEN